MRALAFGIGAVCFAMAHAVTETQKLRAGDWHLFQDFGYSVTVDGNTAIVGAIHADNGEVPIMGAAYVFTRAGDGEWLEAAKLAANDGASFDNFGFRVVLAGDLAFISARTSDVTGINSGAVYIFKRDANGEWLEQDKVTAFDGGEGDEFGFAADGSPGRAVFGAWKNDGEAAETGAAYVFVNQDGSWVQTGKLTASDGEASDRFGVSTALSGTTVVVGAYQNDGSTGAAYIFVEDSNGTWSEQQKLTASDGAEGDRFGYTVAIDGETLVIGASRGPGNTSDSGAAYVFARNADGVW